MGVEKISKDPQIRIPNAFYGYVVHKRFLRMCNTGNFILQKELHGHDGEKNQYVDLCQQK